VDHIIYNKSQEFMVKKVILLIATICIILLMSVCIVTAQQRDPVKENLFFQLPESSTRTPDPNRVSSPTSIDALSTRESSLTKLRSPWRTFDGTNNNLSLDKKAWGSANIPLLRELPAVYGPNNSLNGASRPSPRAVSNLVVDEPVTIFNARNLSTVVYLWGQFLDHDITLTPTGNTESVPIQLPGDEELFTEPISFFRSAVHPGTGVTNTRQQTNLNTAWIDGSVVYGSDLQRAKWLRTFRCGKMKTSAGNLLPWNTTTGEHSAPIDPNAPSMANDGNKTIKTFVAGDVRASEHPVLASFHTLFVREHNRICNTLIARGLRDDELIYQTARKIVGALIQNITYNEFLPALGVTLRPYRGYNSNVRPDLTNIFATAAFRLGHTMVADEVLLFDNKCQPMDPEALELDELFWNPDLLVSLKPEAFLKGIAAHTQYETNIKINSVLRNLLFGDPASPVRFGVDLASLNIQRGRDHGLPDYNTVRKFYTGVSATRFSDISRNDTLARNLRSLYRSINNVDLWTGVLSEDLIPGTSIGRLAHEVQRVQFEKLRDGDYYYFERDPYFPSDVRRNIRETQLSEVIKRNTAITNLQTNMFFVRACPGFSPTPTDEEEEAITSRTLQTEEPVDLVVADPTLFPNPTADAVTVAINNSGEAGTIQLFSGRDGSLVKTITTNANDREIRIDLSDLPKGVYTVNIKSGETTKFIKLVKL
jgi:peroxidase